MSDRDREIGSLTRLLRVTAYVLRFISNCRKNAEKKVGELEAEEIQQSETFWVILMQKEFKSERKFEQVSKRLRIYEDHKGVTYQYNFSYYFTRSRSLR